MLTKFIAAFLAMFMPMIIAINGISVSIPGVGDTAQIEYDFANDKAGSATVAKSPKIKPKLKTNASLLYRAKEPPTILPIGKMLVSRPTKNIDWPSTTHTYPIIILK